MFTQQHISRSCRIVSSPMLKFYRTLIRIFVLLQKRAIRGYATTLDCSSQKHSFHDMRRVIFGALTVLHQLALDGSVRS